MNEHRSYRISKLDVHRPCGQVHLRSQHGTQNIHLAVEYLLPVLSQRFIFLEGDKS